MASHDGANRAASNSKGAVAPHPTLDPAKAPHFLEEMFQKNPVVIISATHCTFCTKLKLLFVQQQIRFAAIEVDVIPSGRAVFEAAHDRSQSGTVPQVFAYGRYVGGYDEMVALHNKGELKHFLRRMESKGVARPPSPTS